MDNIVFSITVNKRSEYRWLAPSLGELVSESGATIWKIEYHSRPEDGTINLIVVRDNGMLWWPNHMIVWYDDRAGNNWVNINGVDCRAN